MEDFKIKLNLKKLVHTGVMNVKGQNSAKRCVVIPIDDNFIYEGQNGNLYLSLRAVTLKNPQEDTHFIKVAVPKAAYEKMTDEHRKNIPIIGNMSPATQQPQQTAQQSAQPTQIAVAETTDEPLPF